MSKLGLVKRVVRGFKRARIKKLRKGGLFERVTRVALKSAIRNRQSDFAKKVITKGILSGIGRDTLKTSALLGGGFATVRHFRKKKEKSLSLNRR